MLVGLVVISSIFKGKIVSSKSQKTVITILKRKEVPSLSLQKEPDKVLRQQHRSPSGDGKLHRALKWVIYGEDQESRAS